MSAEESVEKDKERNSIRPARARSVQLPGALSEERDVGFPPTTQRDPSQGRVPQRVADLFVQRDSEFWFRDGRPAFHDHGQSLSTASEAPEVIAALIEFARARGWQAILLEGTKEFCGLTWRMGKIAGLAVRGYKPSGTEFATVRKLRLSNERDRRETSPAPAPECTQGQCSADEETAVPIEPRTSLGELIGGTLIAHGPAAYRFNLREEPSYFVRIHMGDSQRIIWGRDLQTAIERSATKPEVGEEIGLVRLSSNSLGAKASEQPAKAALPGGQTPSARHQYWIFEKREFFEVRAGAARTLRDVAITPQDGVRRYPELTGAYLSVRAAEIAARALQHVEDRTLFVKMVRDELAETIARGEPWPRVRMRMAADETANRARGGHPPAQDLSR